MLKMTNTVQTMKNIERLGDKYYEKYLKEWDKEMLQKDWWYALEFFFWHSFMRGRKDELSSEYCSFTLEILKNFFQITNDIDKSYSKLKESNFLLQPELIPNFKRIKKLNQNSNALNHEDFNSEIERNNKLIEILINKKEIKINGDENSGYTKSIHLGLDKDIIMVLNVLKFISSRDDKKNIYFYLKNKMISKGVQEVYNELVEFDYIGDKIATFIIRDIILINPDISFKNFDFNQAFPIDTWVEKIARKLDYKGKSDIEEIKKYLINYCKEYNLNQLKFAAGLWYLGVHSLDILMENLDNVSV